MTCFHVVIQGSQKVIVMHYHNFKNEALIKKQWSAQKTNETNKKLKDQKKKKKNIVGCFYLL